MLYTLFSDPDYFHRMYNCSFYSVNDLALEKRQHVGHGIVLLTCGIVFEFLYIPCLFAMFQPHNLKNTCYKFMAYLGVIDSMSMTVAGILSGYFAINGVVYCSYPYTYIIHLFGTFGLGFWFASSTTSVILAINRCTVVANPDLGSRLFDGKMAYVWLAIPTLYIVIAVLFCKPLLYTSIYIGWYSNPHIGYHDELAPWYYNVPHVAHNMSVLFILTVLYVAFGVVLCKRYRQMGTQRQFKKEINSFVQIMCLAILNGTLCFTYAYMNFFPSELITFLSAYSFVLDQGGPTIIYLTLNHTIRTELLKRIGVLSSRSKVMNASTVKDASEVKKIPGMVQVAPTSR